MSNQKLCNILYINVERKEMTTNLSLEDKKIGFVLTGSFCTFSKTIPKMKELIEKGAEVIPIMSFNSYNLDTKFGKAQDFINEIEEITEKKIIHTIQEAEPIGPKRLTDIMVVAPCSGNTMAKLACDIIDTPATMAVKSHLRNNLPVVIAPSTNNGLSGNAKNIGILLNRKHYYFVPFRQDNPITKPHSTVNISLKQLRVHWSMNRLNQFCCNCLIR